MAPQVLAKLVINALLCAAADLWIHAEEQTLYLETRSVVYRTHKSSALTLTFVPDFMVKKRERQ